MNNHNNQSSYNHSYDDHKDNRQADYTSTPILSNATPLVNYRDNINYVNRQSETTHDVHEVPVRHDTSSFDDFDEINPRSQRNQDNNHNKLGSVMRKVLATGVAAAACWAVAQGANAVIERVAPLSVEPSDETLTLHQGDVWWTDYSRLTDEWNQQHPEHPITVDQMSAAFAKVNDQVDRDGDGIGDIPQPGDTQVVPKLSVTTLFGKKS